MEDLKQETIIQILDELNGEDIVKLIVLKRTEWLGNGWKSDLMATVRRMVESCGTVEEGEEDEGENG